MGYHGTPYDAMRNVINKAKNRADAQFKHGRKDLVYTGYRRQYPDAYKDAVEFNKKHGIKPWETRKRALPGLHIQQPSKKKVTLPKVTIPMADDE